MIRTSAVLLGVSLLTLIVVVVKAIDGQRFTSGSVILLALSFLAASAANYSRDRKSE